MADFIQTMKDWRRMCDAYTTDDAATCCQGCPMNGLGCGAIYENGNADPEVIEREVNQWAAEHPEPVYPTWEMYLAERMTADMRDGKTHNPQSVEEYMRRTSIPADIAQKLGIEPKGEP